MTAAGVEVFAAGVVVGRVERSEYAVPGHRLQ